MKYTWRVGRVFGIDIKIDSSWIVIFVLFSWSLAGGYFPKSHPHWSFALNWVLGVVTSLFVFASVLVHELTHSLVAIKQGEKVQSITLFILGGVAQISQEPKEPLKEFRMAVVGPLSSFVLAGLFYVLSRELLPLSEPLRASTSCRCVDTGLPESGGEASRRGRVRGSLGGRRTSTRTGTNDEDVRVLEYGDESVRRAWVVLEDGNETVLVLVQRTTRYLRCVTPGASTTRTSSSGTAPPRWSKRRTPPPSSTGTRCTWFSSSSPARSACCGTLAPAKLT